MAKKKIEKAKFDRTKPHCNVGTVGHVDHGKTTLTAAITKTLQGVGNTQFKDYGEIDNNPEERERLITIAAAHVEYETEKRHYTHIDCPGHQDYIKNMIAGASQLDGVILVVSVVDGVQVQTTEHVILAKEIGLKKLVIFLNKEDLLEGDLTMLELVELEVRELVETYGFSEDTPLVSGSALKALEADENNILKVQKLMDIVDNYVEIPERDLNAKFLMTLDKLLVIPGKGIVITGVIQRGIVKVGDNLELVGPKILSVHCMGIEMYQKTLEQGEPGDNVGIMLKGLSSKDIKRAKDFVLAAENSVKPIKNFKARIYVLTHEEGGRQKKFKTNYKPQFFFKSSNITGAIVLDEEQEFASPGDSLVVDINLIENFIVEKGMKFVIREGKTTVGAGIVL